MYKMRLLWILKFQFSSDSCSRIIWLCFYKNPNEIWTKNTAFLAGISFHFWSFVFYKGFSDVVLMISQNYSPKTWSKSEVLPTTFIHYFLGHLHGIVETSLKMMFSSVTKPQSTLIKGRFKYVYLEQNLFLNWPWNFLDL